MPTNAAGPLLVIGAAVLWGTTGTSQALAPAGASPLSVGAARIAVGGLALLALAYARGGFRDGARWDRRWTALAVISTALYQVTFFGGARLAGVAVGTVIALGSAPAFAGVLGVLLNGERPTGRWVAATVCAVIGCVLLALGDGAGARVSPIGVLLALGAGLSYAAFTAANKHLLADHTADEVMAVSFCAGAVLLAPLLFLTDVRWIASVGGAVVVIHLGLIATGLSYALFGRGLRTVPVAVAGTLSLAEPLTATLLGVLLLREQVPAAGWAGMALIFGGLLLLAVRRPGKR
ncbi:MAG: EamA family transporter [Chloroflexota bacterium]